MKNLLIITLIFTLQGFMVHSKTTEEVVKDFEPVFEELHNEIGDSQSTSHGEGARLEQDFNSKIREQKEAATKITQNDFNDLLAHMKLTITNKGLTEDSKSIQECISQQKRETQNFLTESYEGTNICSTLGSNGLKSFETLHKYYDYQAKMHINLNDAKKKCLENKTPSEVQSCLNQELNFVYKPQVKKMEKEIQDIVKGIKEILDKSVETSKTCLSTAAEETPSKKDSIKTTFEECVGKAA